MHKVLITTFGSYGDLHPYIAIGHELIDRGHRVTIATSASYRTKIEGHGLDFVPVRPDLSLDDPTLLAYVMDRKYGTERVMRGVSEFIRDSYQDLAPIARQADIIVTHPMSAAGVILAEQLQKPWVSSVLAPISFLSAHEPPVPAPSPSLVRVRKLGVGAMRAVWALGGIASRRWVKGILDFRKELGLDTSRNPALEGQHSPQCVLALFSRLLGEAQPDWPPHTHITGFPFFDGHHEQEASLPLDVERFLDEGQPPLVFTLGSSAVSAAGDFYAQSVEAARRLGMRALLLAGGTPVGLPAKLPAGVHVAGYVPHSAVFPRAAVNVHQGGVGTTAQAMRGGRPMLVVPFSHDQPDNAHRMQRLGVARWILRDRYSADSAARELRPLLEDPSYARRAADVGATVRAEHGAAAAADIIAKHRA